MPDGPTRRWTYANCLPPADHRGDLLVTSEILVARGGGAFVADVHVDQTAADTANRLLAESAFGWARLQGGGDASDVDGVSIADLAGREALNLVLMPAARGVLEARAVLAEHEAPDELTLVVPDGPVAHAAVETVAAEAFAHALHELAGRQLTVRRMTSSDPRNAVLVAKYALVRNPAPFGERGTAGRWMTRALCVLLDRAARRRSAAVLLHQYGPTAAFADVLAARGVDDPALIRFRFAPSDIARMLRSRQGALSPFGGRPRPSHIGADLRAFAAGHPELLARRLTVAGVDLSPVAVPRLIALAEELAPWATARVPEVRRYLRRRRVATVLVPFDSAPEPRLLVRAAQAEGVPTVLVNDGWKGDDHQPEGMIADRVCALSSSTAERYFAARRPNTPVTVTGDPRTDLAARPERTATGRGAGLRRILVGSFTFSPVDLLCRRSDPETFLDEVLTGLAAAEQARRARITLKLHPADRAEVYTDVLTRHADLDVHVVSTGDVSELFPATDLYLSTYTTSLLQAVVAGVPIAYYRVNDQRLHAPFGGDEVLERATASSPAELTELLQAGRALRDPGSAWLERYLGPNDGRCTDRLLAEVRRSIS